MSKITTDWSPRYLGKALFQQESCWVTNEGREVRIAAMDDGHLLNTTLMLEGLCDQIQFELRISGSRRVWLSETPLYQALKREIRRRMSGSSDPVRDVLSEGLEDRVLDLCSDEQIVRAYNGLGLLNWRDHIGKCPPDVLAEEIGRRLHGGVGRG